MSEAGKAYGDYTVYFCAAELASAMPRLRNRSIAVFPSGDSWNDFGFHSACRFLGKDSAGNEFSGHLRMGFLGGESEPQSVIEANARATRELVEAREFPDFFTLQYEMQNYRDLIGKLGLEEAGWFFLGVHDLVAVRHRRKPPSWYDKAIASDIFSLSFVRNSESFFAFHNAGTLLDGLIEERLADFSNGLDLRFKLDGFDNEHEFMFRFEQKGLLGKRICILIGKNGVGKSQALTHIVHSAMSEDGALTDGSRGRPILSGILAIATPGETQYTFPEEAGPQSRVRYRRLHIARGSGKAEGHGLNELIVQLIRNYDEIAGQSRWSIFRKAVEDIVPFSDIGLQLRKESAPQTKRIVQRGENRYVRLEQVRHIGGEQKSLEVWNAIEPGKEPVILGSEDAHPLSSGQLAFIRFAAQACLYLENGTLVLLDEPETHLHPNYISLFVDLLETLLSATGSVAIVATHSAYFVREMPRSQVHVIRERRAEGEKYVDISIPRLKTLGADIGAISHFVFEDEMTSRLVNKVRRALEERPQDAAEVLKGLEGELSSEAIMQLRRELAP